MAAPELIPRRDSIRQRVLDARARGARIGVVPTMGALHAGHLSLVRACAAQCDCTVVTVFVNPIQFGPDEDLSRYPRDLGADLESLAHCGVDYVFAPDAAQLYRQGHSTYVQPPRVAEPWEGAFRPGHFRGVSTVVLKLFHIVPADLAFFGQKDYQQALVVQCIVDELDIPIVIQVCPTVREPDGLAMSSRNAHLSPAEREQALGLSASLRLAMAMFRDGETRAQPIRDAMDQALRQAGIQRIDYAALAHPRTLDSVTTVDEKTIALVAGHVGDTRLIDNTRLG